MLTWSPSDNSLNMPAGPITEQPVTKFPSIMAVGANGRSTWVTGLCMQMHVGHSGVEGKHETGLFRRAVLRLLQRSQLFLRRTCREQADQPRRQHFGGQFFRM